MVIAAVLLHIGIALCMGLVTFSLMMLTGVLVFIPAPAVRHLFSRFGHELTGLRPIPAAG
jgi:hypothetical protein